MTTDLTLTLPSHLLAPNLGISGGVSPLPAVPPSSPTDSSPDSLRPTPLLDHAQEVNHAVQDANHKLQQVNIGLQFQVDLGLDGAIRSVKLFDPLTQTVILQLPSPEMLAVRDRIDAMIASNQTQSDISAGLLFSKKA